MCKINIGRMVRASRVRIACFNVRAKLSRTVNSVERRTSGAPQLHPVQFRCPDQSILAEYGPSAQASGMAAVGPIIIVSREFAKREVFIKTFERGISGPYVPESRYGKEAAMCLWLSRRNPM